jgi:hypothetical protein
MPALPLGCGRPEPGRRERKPLRPGGGAEVCVQTSRPPAAPLGRFACHDRRPGAWAAKRGLKGATPGSDHTNPRGSWQGTSADRGCRRSGLIIAGNTPYGARSPTCITVTYTPPGTRRRPMPGPAPAPGSRDGPHAMPPPSGRATRGSHLSPREERPAASAWSAWQDGRLVRPVPGTGP